MSQNNTGEVSVILAHKEIHYFTYSYYICIMKVTKPLVWVTDNTDYQKKHRLWGQIDLRVKHRSALFHLVTFTGQLAASLGHL